MCIPHPLNNDEMIHGVGTRRAATQAASQVPKAVLQPTNAGLAAIATPVGEIRLNQFSNYFL